MWCCSAIAVAFASCAFAVRVQFLAPEHGRFKREPQGPPGLSTGPPGPPPTTPLPGITTLPQGPQGPPLVTPPLISTPPPTLPPFVVPIGPPIPTAPPTGGFPTTPLPYVCVPAGTCMTSTIPPSDTNSIDPRILTPNLSLCPPGQVPCYGGQPTGSQCGIRYVNNTNTADGPTTAGAYPWEAYIVNQTSFTGSGVLLDQYHVLTAAHKVNLNQNTPSNVRVSMGVWDPTSMASSQNFTAAAIRIHPQFTSDTLRNDIAIIRLSSPVALGFQTNIGTACLPNSGQSFAGRQCIVSGWGQTAFGANDAPTRSQRQATVPIVDYNTCRTSMSQPNLLGTNVDRYLDGSGEICAGGRSQIDACTQDGGAPLVCADQTTGRFTIAGLVIWGKRCGDPGVYGVYVNVPFYRSWIDQTVASF